MSIPIKNEREIEKMRAACGLAAQILGRLAGMIRPGITTGDVDRSAKEMMLETGCKSAFLGYKGFPGHICISMNEEVVHGIGGNRRIQYGDVVKIDCGVIKDGWVGDNAITVPVGAVRPEWQRLLTVTDSVLERAIPLAVAGRRLGDLCAFIEEEVVANGYTVVREFVGHGVGRSLHEEPQVPNFGRPGTGPKLKPGMTLAIEPMVNLGTARVKTLSDGWTVITADGQPSAHFEHTILITKDAPEVLTKRVTSS